MLGGEYDVIYPYRFGNHAERKVNMPFTIATQEDMDGFENSDELKNGIEWLTQNTEKIAHVKDLRKTVEIFGELY